MTRTKWDVLACVILYVALFFVGMPQAIDATMNDYGVAAFFCGVALVGWIAIGSVAIRAVWQMLLCVLRSIPDDTLLPPF